MHIAISEMDAAITEAGLERFIRTTGSLDLYDSARDRAAAGPEWRLRRAAGFASREVSGKELKEIQPGLAPQFTHGVFAPEGRQVQNPYEFASALAAWLATRGVRFVKAAVARVVPSSSGDSGPSAAVQTEAGDIFAARSVVIAGGAWSKTLAAGLGDPVPLDTERGYNTTLAPAEFRSATAAIFQRPRLCRLAARGRRDSRWRRGGVRRADGRAEFRPRQGAA